MAFVKDPIREDGTLDESLLHVKIIDFGISGLVFNGKSYGLQSPDKDYPELESSSLSTEAFRGSRSQKLPNNFLTAIDSFGKNSFQIEAFIIQEADKLTGGSYRKSVKTRRRKHGSRKNHKRSK
jgi:hypothetical protein